MNRTVNLLIIAIYTAAIPVLAGLSEDSLNRLATIAGGGLAEVSGRTVSEADAVALALAATNTRSPAVNLIAFANHVDAEAPTTERLASLR